MELSPVQWQANGAALAGATSATLTLPNLQPENAGIYTAVATNSFGTVASDPAIVGVTSVWRVIGAGAAGAAQPAIVIGSAGGETRIAGGDLLQANGQAVAVHGLTQLKFTAGSDSAGRLLPAATNRAVPMQDGVDVTAQVVVNPSP